MASMTSEQLQAELQQLVEQNIASEKLFAVVEKLAGESLKSGQRHGVNACLEDKLDLAGDFICHLHKRSPVVLAALKSISLLRREFGRWITHRHAPGSLELWTVLSESLLTLEKAGKVQRQASQRQYNNSNNTIWALAAIAENSSQAHDIDSEKLKKILPQFSAKHEHDRVLKPTEATQCVLRALECAGRWISMEQLYAAIKQHVFCLQVIRQPNKFDEDGVEPDWSAEVRAEEVTPDLEAGIGEEIQWAVDGIWQGSGRIRGGRDKSISGQNILCSYWLPKTIYGRKVVLEQFGPSSTVNDIVDKLVGLMRDYISQPSPNQRQTDAEMLACQRINSEIIEKLAVLCSEKGYCQLFS